MPFVQTLRCSCEKMKGQVDKWRYRCEVPLNKDTERERERERGNSSSRTITGTYYTYEVYLC